MSVNEPLPANPPPVLSDPDITELDSQSWRTLGEDEPTELFHYQLYAAEAVGITNVGQERHLNEDFFILNHQVEQRCQPFEQAIRLDGLYILCDGMGGHAQGEVASALAAQTISEYFQEQQPDTGEYVEALHHAVLAANTAIYDLNEKQVSLGQDRMGTTLVMALLRENQLHIAHVGDSRFYRFTESQGLEQLTVDHEVAQMAIQNGMQPALAYARPDAYQLTQALGPRASDSLIPDINTYILSEDTLLLLCSDGLTDNNLLEIYAESHLQPYLQFDTDLNACANGLIDLANAKNGHDNITVIAVRLGIHPPG